MTEIEKNKAIAKIYKLYKNGDACYGEYLEEKEQIENLHDQYLKNYFN